MKKFNYCLIAAVVLFVTGCVQTRYAWHNYDQNLYDHYKNPGEYDQFVENLKEVIEDGEADGKLPPGMYAEYGYALYEKGNFPEAINYFNKEQDKWPESKVIMTKMINNAQKKSVQVEKFKVEDSTKNLVKTTEVAK